MHTLSKYTSGEKILASCLVILFFLPPLVFVPGFLNGQCIFVSYREPKLAALQILSWLFISVFTMFGLELFRSQLLAAMKNRVLWLLMALTGYSLLSSLWAVVPHAAYYEAAQWATMTVLFAIFLAMFSDIRWRHLALWSLWLSFGLVTITGLLQLAVNIPWLRPVEGACKITSTFGAKNTCFVSLASQYFLLLYAIYYGTRHRKPAWWITGSFLFAIESIYIFLSISRTAYAGIAVGLCVMLLLLLAGQIAEERWQGLLLTLAMCCVPVLFAIGIFTYAPPDLSKNIIMNGDFERLNRAGMAEGWQFYEYLPVDGAAKEKNDPQKSHAVTEMAHGGLRAIMLNNQTGSRTGWRGRLTQFPSDGKKNAFVMGGWGLVDRNVEKGRVSLWTRVTLEDGKKIAVELSWKDASPGEWEYREDFFSFHKPVQSVQPYLFLYDVNGSVIFDDIFIVPAGQRMFPALTNFWKQRMAPYLRPGYFFENTARGAALLDTIDMVKANPLGVGAGNWGFAYPLYHRKMPLKAFSRTTQIRRAHNSYAEYLGELGYAGLALLLLTALLPLKRAAAMFINSEGGGRLETAIIISTIITVMTMMLATFYLEYPYRKFLFVFILSLAVISCVDKEHVHRRQ
jgi:hypothetical protein